jgi:hypothetical protein
MNSFPKVSEVFKHRLKFILLLGLIATVGLVLVACASQIFTQKTSIISTLPTPEAKSETSPSLVIITDKREYSSGEIINVIIRNNLNESVFMHHIAVGDIEYLERKNTKGDWEQLFVMCQYPHCVYDYDAGPLEEIKPAGSRTFEWKPLIYINGTPKTTQPSPGIYRLKIIYQIRRGASSESWEWKTAHSSEFTIK